MTRRLKDPNQQLAALISEAGFSSKGLARRVVDLGRMRGYRNLKYNHSSVERWLRGEQPRPPTPELLSEVFGAALGRPVSLAMLGMAQERTADGAALQIQPTPADAARIVRSLTEGDLKRQRVLMLSDFDLAAYSSAALRWLLAPRTAITASKGTRRIGMADIREIREPPARSGYSTTGLAAGASARPSLSTCTAISLPWCDRADAPKRYDGTSSLLPRN